jgi:predicted PurR-regulated permease PerM
MGLPVMPHPSPGREVSRVFHFLGTLVLVVVCLYWARQVFIPLALAVLLTFILTPLVVRLQRRGVGRTPAVLLVVLLTGAVLVGLGWVITAQLKGLLTEIPNRRDDIKAKITALQGQGPGALTEFTGMVQEIMNKLEPVQDRTPQGEPIVPVRVIEKPGYLNWFSSVAGSALDVLVSGFFMAILVVFMLFYREDLRNRFLRAVGHGRLTVTTRALDEAASRISRFLSTQLAINFFFGVIWAIALRLAPGGEHGLGLSYAFLWGFLACALRFVPYVGTWVALAFPLLLSVTTSDPAHPWLQPLFILGVYVVLELVTANVVEPLLFGHHTGVSPVALLVAAVFWAWLWGPLGLVLSTPLTVCLVVLGRYVPPLEVFDVLLGAEPPLETELSYYQRLVAGDEDEAIDLVETYLQEHSVEAVYDEVLVPALVLAQRDRERGDLDAHAQEFVREATGRVVEELLAPQVRISLVATGRASVNEEGELTTPAACRPLALGCPARDEGDRLGLTMLGQVLEAASCQFEVVSPDALTSEILARVGEEHPAFVCIGSLPPGGLAQTIYLVKRLRAQFPDLRILVGRWGQAENVEQMKARLREAGATEVATTLLETRSAVLPVARFAALHEEAPAAAG